MGGFALGSAHQVLKKASMTRYFFNLNGASDDEGTELKNDDAATRHAIICVGQVMLDNPSAMACGNDVSLVVADERGLDLFSINVCVTLAQVAETLV